MPILQKIPLLDDLLESRRPIFGSDFTAYRNHDYRVANFCIELAQADAEQIKKIAVAVAFHDLGVWTHQTLDYLEPSMALARDFLIQTDRSAWKDEIDAMILEHHKLRALGPASVGLAEAFRKADWIDVSLGALSFGLPRSFIAAVRATFPNAGFHKKLVALTMAQVRKHPLNPMPMMRF